MDNKTYEVLIAGGGAAGLTAAAYLSRSGRSVLLCEAGGKTGGLVNSFKSGGFVFDGGIRAFENSGILFPMLRELGIRMAVAGNPVTLGIGDALCRLSASGGLEDYQALLSRVFPENTQDIGAIIAEIRKVMGYMDVLYGIDNPLFGDVTKDPEYLLKTLLPWLVRYRRDIRKVRKLSAPVVGHLRKFTDNRALIDMITQHFFAGTPASFALSYFSLYLDYSYPNGGTGVLAEMLTDKVRSGGGEILLNTKIVSVDPAAHEATTEDGRVFRYKKLIWACGMKTLYAGLQTGGLTGRTLLRSEAQGRLAAEAAGTESILTLYLTANKGADTFSGKVSAHSFYTPAADGLSTLTPWQDAGNDAGDQNAVKEWLRRYLALTTYEISIPALRDPALAPSGQTGLIVSTLFDYALTEAVRQRGWYEEMKAFCTAEILDVLDRSAFPLAKASVLGADCSTPLTLERLTGNSGGAVTGWAFTNRVSPAVNDMRKITRAVNTPIPDVFQAGHWTFSPAGLPIAVLTGKLAADATGKALKTHRGRIAP
jgi:phytoene dehydrogenase-like protein